ncbi:MAG: hypothetical protein BVN35_17670 [Proteobacteria bacterium ST_bin11]|nr:MAG: hypothetical protein BVN35_17670 [Proteobacteria bacterium ST_bin11]
MKSRAKRELREVNPWKIASRALMIFVATSMFFMMTTIGYTVYRMDQWTGIVVAGTSFIMAYALMSIAVSRGVQPIFDWPTLFLNSVHVGLSSSVDGTVSTAIGGEIHWIETIVYLVVLFAASILGNGLARAVVGDNTYALIAKNIPAGSTAVKAFFIEWAVQSALFIGGQQLLFHKSTLEWTALITGTYFLGSQAIGLAISGSCYNTMYWLGLSVIGTGIKERFDGVTTVPVHWFDSDSWVYPVSTIVAFFTALIVGFIIKYIKAQEINANKLKSRKSYETVDRESDSHQLISGFND